MYATIILTLPKLRLLTRKLLFKLLVVDFLVVTALCNELIVSA